MSATNNEDPQQSGCPSSARSQLAELPKDILDQFRDPCGVVRIGNFVIGAVDHVNGASSERRTLAISRYEAKLLARHWLEVIEDIERWWAESEQVGSSEMRERAYGYKRVDELIDSGLITVAEAQTINEEVWLAHAAEWQAIKGRSASS
jgi:hypothetical protein